MFLFEALWLNDNRLYDTPENLQSCNLADVPNFVMCLLRKQFWYGLKRGGHNVFKAVNLPTNWLKIPKSVNVTDFPIEQLLSTYCTLAEICCDSLDEILVDGRFWSRSCRLAVGVVGVVGTFSLPVTCVIPRADSCTIIRAVRQRHRYEFGDFPVMAGDCGDEIPSKSKPQSAGVTSSANPANLLVNR